jgi:hypothetical protein
LYFKKTSGDSTTISVDGLQTNIKKLTENSRNMKEYKTERPRLKGKYYTVSQKQHEKA